MSYAKRSSALQPCLSDSSLSSSGSCSSSSACSGLFNKFPAHNGLVKCVCLGQTSGEVFASVSNDEQIKLWVTGSSDCLMTLKQKSSTETCQFSHNEEVLATGSLRGVVRLWNLNNQKSFRMLKAHEQTINNIDFFPSGDFIITGSGDRTVKLWDIKKQTPVHKYEGHSRGVIVQKFSPDGKWIASGDSNGVIKLWDLTACKLLAELRAHSGSILDIKFHPSVRLLATSAADGCICFWELETFQLISCLYSSGSSSNGISGAMIGGTAFGVDIGPISRMHFHPNGHQLIACGRDKYVVCHLGDDTFEVQSMNDLQFGHARDLAVAKDGLMVASFFSNYISLHQIKWTDLTRVPVNRQFSATSSTSRRSFEPDDLRKTYNLLESMSSRTSEEVPSSLGSNECLEIADVSPAKVFNPQRELSRTPPESSSSDEHPNTVNSVEDDLHLQDARAPCLRDHTRPHRYTRREETSRNTSVPPVGRLVNSRTCAGLAAKARVQPVHKSQSMRALDAIGTHVSTTSTVPEWQSDYSNANMVAGEYENAYELRHAVSTHALRTPNTAANSRTVDDENLQNKRALLRSVRDFYTPQSRKTGHRQTAIRNQRSPCGGGSMDSVHQQPDLIPKRGRARKHCTSAAQRKSLSVSMGDLALSAGVPNNARALDTVLAEIAADHLEVQMLIAQRDCTMQIALKARQTDPIRAFQIVSSSQDLTLVADLLRLTIARPKDWNVHLCQRILPHIDTLLRSKQEVCVETASQAISFIMESMYPIIQQNIRTSHSIGVDLEQEKRFQTAMDCHKQLVSIKAFILKQQCAMGDTGVQFRKLVTILDQLDSKS